MHLVAGTGRDSASEGTIRGQRRKPLELEGMLKLAAIAPPVSDPESPLIRVSIEIMISLSYLRPQNRLSSLSQPVRVRAFVRTGFGGNENFAQLH